MRDFDPTASEFISTGYIAKSRSGGVLYDPATIVTVGASLIGSSMQADAAGDAADAQASSARQADATQRYMYDTTRADNAPFRETGVAANNRLAYLMGLSPNNGRAPAAGGISSTAPTTYMPGQSNNALWEKILGDFNTQHQAAYGVPMNRDWNSDGDAMTTKSNLDAQYKTALQSDPAYMAQQAGQTATASGDPAYGSLNRRFGASDLAGDAVYQSGLQFGLDEGTKGINRQAAAGGSMLSGATLKALTRFGNNYGSTKANESYNRFNNDNTTQYNRLAGLSGAGQQATNQVSAAGQNMANNVSQNQIGAGNARASGYIGQSNAWQNGINGAASALGRSNALSGFSNPSVIDGGYGVGQGSAYSGTVDNGLFTPNRAGF